VRSSPVAAVKMSKLLLSSFCNC